MFTVCVDQLLMSSVSRFRAQHQRPDPSSEPSAPTQPLNLKGAPADEDLQTKVINKRLGGGGYKRPQLRAPRPAALMGHSCGSGPFSAHPLVWQL